MTLRNIFITILLLSTALSVSAKLTFSGSIYQTVSIKPEASTGLEEILVINPSAPVTVTYEASSASSSLTWQKFDNRGGGYATDVTGITKNGNNYSIPFSGEDTGYIITDKSKSTLMFITTASSVGTFTVPLPKNALQVGDYLAFPMFCSFNYSSDHTLHQMTCYAIPNLAGGKQLSIISQSQSVASNFAQITAREQLGRIIVTLKLKDDASQVNNVTVYCVYQTDPSKGQTMVSGEYYKTIGTMKAGETKTATFTNLTSGKSYKIYVIANGVWVAKGLFPFSSGIDPDLQ